jgi:hypothetical protein
MKLRRKAKKLMDNSNPHDIITSAEQLVASFWQAEKDEEQTNDGPPPGSEALEDEVKALEDFVNEDLQRRLAADADLVGVTITFRIVELDRIIGADVPLWRIAGCAEGYCGDPECKKRHRSRERLLVAKRIDGNYANLQFEEVFDRSEDDEEPVMIKINLAEIIGNAVRQQVEEPKKSQGDEDDRPPAAQAKPANVDPDPPEITAVLPGVPGGTRDTRRIEDTAPALPVYTIDPRRANDRPGLLRRVWGWLWSDDDE